MCIDKFISYLFVVNRLQDQQMESDSTARNSNSPVPLPSLSQGISKEHSDGICVYLLNYTSRCAHHTYFI